MFLNKGLALVLIGIVLVGGLVSIAMAAADSGTDQILQPFLSDGNIGVQQTATIQSVKYVVNYGRQQVLDRSNPYIYITEGDNLFISVTGRCTGPTSQKGVLEIADMTALKIVNGILVTPGKTKTLTTNPPLSYPTSGGYSLLVGVASPDGTGDFVTIIVNVAAG